MITDVDGVLVGHWTDADAATGCTVIRFPDGTVASGEIRGGAPATREFALLDPSRMVARLDAVVLSGGSAFGLAAADGVMDTLAAEGVGFDTAGGVVPIVVGMALYDLATGDGSVRPRSQHGRLACRSATAGPVALGRVGAATGATVDKWKGPEFRRPGGFVAATARAADGVVVACLVAVNAFGSPGATAAEVSSWEPAPDEPDPWTNTTIGVVATNARLDKGECLLVAQSAHDGLARSVSPAHTSADGDAFVVAATGGVEGDLRRIRAMAVTVVEEAILGLATATPAPGLAAGPATDRPRPATESPGDRR